MSPIKNVAVVGATGGLGPTIVRALLEAGFTVTALQRAASKSTLPEPDKISCKRVDNFQSVSSLAEALAGQDAVVSAISDAALQDQIPLIDAAVSAGVKRFIPSEFGLQTRTTTTDTTLGKILAPKVAVTDHLMQKASENPGFTWTGIGTGFWFDYCLRYGVFGFDAKARTATVFDSGNERFYTTNMATIGRAIAAVLQQPDKTANRFLNIASFTPTQNEILAVAQELTGGGDKWAVTNVKTADLEKKAEETLAREGADPFSALLYLLQIWFFRDGAGHVLKVEDNAAALLGLPADDIKETTRAWLAEAGAI